MKLNNGTEIVYFVSIEISVNGFEGPEDYRLFSTEEKAYEYVDRVMEKLNMSNKSGIYDSSIQQMVIDPPFDSGYLGMVYDAA